MAGKIPQSFIDELLQRVDIVDVIDRRVPLKKAGKDYQARCPFHDEKTPSFTVSQAKQFYHCFGCGANGSAIGFLMQYEHMEFPEAVEELAQGVGLSIPREQGSTAPREREDHGALLALIDRASSFYRDRLRNDPGAKTAVDYLKGRGVSGELARRFELGFAPARWNALIEAFAPDERGLAAMERAGLVTRREGGGYYDRFRARIVFPIRDHRGRAVAFGGRIVDAGEPKYLNSPETPIFHKGSELYGLFAARDGIREAGRAIVVEGYMDVLALAQHGIGNAVATLGTATTPRHLHRLFRVAPHVVFCFDGDRAGREAARKAMEVALTEMRDGREVSFLFLPEGEDPDDFVRGRGAREFEDAVRAARPLDELLFESLSERTDVGRADGQARLMELARPLIGSIPPGSYREIVIRRLAERTGFDDTRYLEDMIRATGATTATRAPPRPSAAARRPSPLAYLISLLLQHPELIAALPGVEGLETLDHPAAQPLVRLIGMLRAEPTLSTAALVERFRDTPHHERLEKLAGWNHRIVEGRLEETLVQYAANVERLAIDSSIDRLLGKQGLDEAEKADLKRLLKLQASRRLDVAGLPGDVSRPASRRNRGHS